ncbi:GNAT family N-acetyltransferase [Streptomyces bicolor]|uniref:GNAT family N-acetyltransferase n=1 Tax=Streptomyces bicolor TaxID=66874 RepID=UPI0009979553
MCQLPANVRRPGFTAALALQGGEVVGFATAWTALSSFPSERCYPQAAASFGPKRTAEWLCDSREIDELAVRSDARGTGLATGLLEAVTTDTPEGRSWLLTSVRSGRAMAFYRRQGWTRATHPAPDGNGIAVFLGPRHPARSLASPAL